jgi:hypothetical protein
MNDCGCRKQVLLGRCTGPITAILPEGRHESSPGWSEAQPWDSVPNMFSRPVGGAVKVFITVRCVHAIALAN